MSHARAAAVRSIRTATELNRLNNQAAIKTPSFHKYRGFYYFYKVQNPECAGNLWKVCFGILAGLN